MLIFIRLRKRGPRYPRVCVNHTLRTMTKTIFEAKSPQIPDLEKVDRRIQGGELISQQASTRIQTR